MDNANEYREIIERFARDRVDTRVPNGTPLHASILIETMFNSATAEMRIFTRELDADVFGKAEIKKAVSKFISKPYANLKILLQRSQNEDWVKSHPLIKMLNEINVCGLHGKVEIRNAIGSYAKDDANHFAVMDNDGFRFELDHDKCKALANFNEVKTAKKLVQIFDQAFDIATAKPENSLFKIDSKAV